MHLNKSDKKHNPRSKEPFSFSYEAMGTWWRVTIWDDLSTSLQKEIRQTVIDRTTQFDETYSRFIPSSYVMQKFSQPGIIDNVPKELCEMLHLYTKFHKATGGKINPLIGQVMMDAGYDPDYSLKPGKISSVPDFTQIIQWISPTSLSLSQPVILDLGAIGKSYFVDTVRYYLLVQGIQHFLVDGSGDLSFQSPYVEDFLKVGMEHPNDPKKVVGVIRAQNTSICSSGINRRTWGQYHHIIDPDTKTSPQGILATWVTAESAAVADGLATSLFLVEPESLSEMFQFEYAILSKDMAFRRSKGFLAELY